MFLVRRKGKGTNDENDHLRKTVIDNKNTEKRIFVRICFSFYVFMGERRWEVGERGREVGESTPMSTPIITQII